MSSAYRGILPAMQLPFERDLSIDEAELRRFTGWLAGHKGIGGLVTNGHTGEVFALTAEQRAEATRIVVDELGGRLPVVSGSAAKASAKRSGKRKWRATPVPAWNIFRAIGAGSGLDIVVHVYPAWTPGRCPSAA
jgi:4-hydroxy-tetrahydrodipicolinate synthase